MASEYKIMQNFIKNTGQKSLRITCQLKATLVKKQEGHMVILHNLAKDNWIYKMLEFYYIAFSLIFKFIIDQIIFFPASEKARRNLNNQHNDQVQALFITVNLGNSLLSRDTFFFTK